jgi:endonuclease-3
MPAFPVDTHIHRLAQRWGLSSGKTVEQTEADLKALFPEEAWHDLHLQIIYFGREYCPAQRHDPAACPVCSWAAASPFDRPSSAQPKPAKAKAKAARAKTDAAAAGGTAGKPATKAAAAGKAAPKAAAPASRAAAPKASKPAPKATAPAKAAPKAAVDGKRGKAAPTLPRRTRAKLAPE